MLPGMLFARILKQDKQHSVSSEVKVSIYILKTVTS